MQARGADRPKHAATPAQIVAVVCLGLALIGASAYLSLRPHEYPPPMTKTSAVGAAGDFHRWAGQKYKETGGDFNKLSPEDQQRMNAGARGRGKAFFRTFANAP